MQVTSFILLILVIFSGCDNPTEKKEKTVLTVFTPSKTPLTIGGESIDYTQIVTINKKKKNRELSQTDQSKLRHDGLLYLNFLRQKAGMIPYTQENHLNISAYNHAHYLMLNNAWGHGESSINSGFTGAGPWDRALYAGYLHNQVAENLSGGNDSVENSIDGLFSAIYHRFGFLSFKFDEIGIGAETSDTHPYGSAYNYNMGISQLSTLCGGESAAYGYTGVCADTSLVVDASQYENAIKENQNLNPSYVLWPYDTQNNSIPVFYSEDPDPLPDCSVSGYPVSIQFNEQKSGQITLESFKLYYENNNSEVTNTRLLDSQSDPNSRFSSYEFALYPIDRLSWDTSYYAKVQYLEDDISKTISWSFKTKSLPLPYYNVLNAGSTFNIKSAQTYLFYLPPSDCNDLTSGFSTSHSGELSVATSYYDLNTLQITVTGTAGTVNISPSNGRNFSLIIANDDNATYPKSLPISMTLKSGWNLIGPNTNLTLPALQEQLGADNLLIIQGPVKSYKKENVDNGLDFLNDFTQMEAGKGYWIKLADRANITYQTIASDLSITLQSGWNLINPTTELTLEEIKTQVGVENLITIQGPEKSYKKENVDNGLDFLNDFEKFEEPRGYWVNVKNSSQLNFVDYKEEK